MHGFTAAYTPYSEKQFTEAWRRYLQSMPPEEQKQESTDDFIKRWSEDLERMYENRTAGDHSFTGFVVALMWDIQNKGVHLG